MFYAISLCSLLLFSIINAMDTTQEKNFEVTEEEIMPHASSLATIHAQNARHNNNRIIAIHKSKIDKQIEKIKENSENKIKKLNEKKVELDKDNKNINSAFEKIIIAFANLKTLADYPQIQLQAIITTLSRCSFEDSCDHKDIKEELEFINNIFKHTCKITQQQKMRKIPSPSSSSSSSTESGSESEN